MKNPPNKIEPASFERKVSVIDNPFIFKCERPFGYYTQEDIDHFKEIFEHYIDDEFDDAS